MKKINRFFERLGQPVKRTAKKRRTSNYGVTARVEYGDRNPPSLKDQIEAWNLINKKEMVFGYNKGGSLMAVTPENKRTATKAAVQIERAAEYESLVHTHLQRPKSEIAKNIAVSPLILLGLDLRTSASILPSKNDIIMYALAKNYAVKKLRKPNHVKNLTLSVINRKGKEIGRITIEIPQKKLIQTADKYFSADKKERKKMEGAFKGREFYQWANTGNARVKFIPGKGYKFDWKKEIFLKEKKEK